MDNARLVREGDDLQQVRIGWCQWIGNHFVARWGGMLTRIFARTWTTSASSQSNASDVGGWFGAKSWAFDR
jgi:hypothetical protein